MGLPFRPFGQDGLNSKKHMIKKESYFSDEKEHTLPLYPPIPLLPQPPGGRDWREGYACSFLFYPFRSPLTRRRGGS